MKEEHKPHVGHQTKYPETTLKAVLLGIVLSAILAAANAYLGLFAGLTVSASIPAAVISMAILKMFKKHNILENNAVQTAASAGESLAAGVIFTFPALVLMGYWSSFNYAETALIALSGGILGVFFTIPLRKALIIDMKLTFPEGIATSEVLKTGEKGGKAIRYLVWGGVLGAVVKLVESGLKLWEGIFAQATFIGQRTLGFVSLNLSPALISVGYIVGMNISLVLFMGGVISWWIGIPLYTYYNGNPDGLAPVDLGYAIWSSQIRYLGVGGMIVGGVWALLSLYKTLGAAFRAGVKSFRKGTDDDVIRTEQDTPMKWVIMGIGIMIVPIFVIYLREIHDVSITFVMAIIMLVAGFLFASVAGYMAGLVGSSNNPISGVTIATILTSSLILLALMGSDATGGPVAAIMIGSVVACAAAIAGDNMQDLKAGYLLGATPFRQQLMQFGGVIAAALTLPFVLDLLNTGYGFGPKSAENPDSLTAPQATLMQSVAEGVFGDNLPWDMIIIGMVLGVIVIIIDQIQAARKASFRIPVLALAVGLYLPFELDSAIMLGGVVAWLAERRTSRIKVSDHKGAKQASSQHGLLFASGLITGEALIGIILAIPVAVYGSSDVLALTEGDVSSIPGLLIILALCVVLYQIIVSTYKRFKQ